MKSSDNSSTALGDNNTSMTRRQRVHWTRGMVRQILEIFIQESSNPLVNGKTAIQNQLLPIYERDPIIICGDGKEKRLQEIILLDLLAQKFYRR